MYLEASGIPVKPTHDDAVALRDLLRDPTCTAAQIAALLRTWRLTRVIVTIVLAVLAAVVVASHTSDVARAARLDVGADASFGGVLQAGGLLFFAFAGYARIATLGEEARDPARTIPRAIPLALGITLIVYALVAVSALTVLGPTRLAESSAPLSEQARAAGADWPAPVVQVGAAMAALGSLLALILGVSRTTLAMARDRHLPHPLSAVHPRFKVPHRAELAVGAVVAVLAAVADVRGAIGFSSFGVLAYYAIANASAWTLTPQECRLAGSSPLSAWPDASSSPSPCPLPR